MSFANKTNGREYMNKTNSNKNQTMTFRNPVTNTQYSNSSNGDLYPYDDKSQQSCNSPKLLTENHGVPQHNTSPRDPYYKSNNTRNKQYHHNKNYNDKHSNYYNQRPNSPEDVVIPEIEHLREFINEQTERFKQELLRHECQTSNSPSPGAHQYDDVTNNRYSKYGSLSRTNNGLSSSHSLGSIASSSNTNTQLITSTVSPSCSDNSNRHPDARVGSNTFSVVKNNANGLHYNKHSSQNTGKPSPGLTRNLSHDETFSKSPGITNNKDRNDSPINNAEKSGINKTQFPCPSGSIGIKSDPKKALYRHNPFTFASGNNPAMHQMNQNNSVTALSLAIDIRKSDQQSRPTMSAVLRNGMTNNSNTKTQIRRPIDPTSTRLDDEVDVVPNFREVISVANSTSRRISHSGSTTDSQEIAHSAIDTPTAHEQFFTPDPSASPCSNRSSPDAGALNFHCQRAGQRKVITNCKVTNNE